MIGAIHLFRAGYASTKSRKQIVYVRDHNYSFQVGNWGAGDAQSYNTIMYQFLFISGSLFLWLYWPSFNSILVAPGNDQQRAIINTYLSLTACTVSVFAASAIVNKQKLQMVCQYCTCIRIINYRELSEIGCVTRVLT